MDDFLYDEIWILVAPSGKGNFEIFLNFRD